MQLIRGLHNSQPYLSGCALTIGNFDGVHLGHQAILRHLRQKANELNLPMVYVTHHLEELAYLEAETVQLKQGILIRN